MKKNEAKRYILSSLVTFLATFVVVFGAELSVMGVENITASSFTDGTVLGMLLVAVRLAVKAVFEKLLNKNV